MTDFELSTRVMACGGPATPDPRVLRALTTPVIGQFDPDFTALMDDVMRLARQVFLTRNARCFAISATRQGGMEAVFNSLLEPGDTVALLDDAHEELARRVGATIVASQNAAVVVATPAQDVMALAKRCHARGALVVVDATERLGGGELRVHDWAIDCCIAGVDRCIGAPPGLTLVTYSDAVEARMRRRKAPPATSYLDLLQLQAYWSPERLNHHTAPTSLVYALREALRLLLDEGVEARWSRHRRIAEAMCAGFDALQLRYRGGPLTFELELPQDVDEAEARDRLRKQFGVHVGRIDERHWRIGLLGTDARTSAVAQLLGGLQHVLVHALAGLPA